MGLTRLAKIVSDAGLAMVERDGVERDEAWDEDEDEWWRHFETNEGVGGDEGAGADGQCND